jgi:hypothetical protein
VRFGRDALSSSTPPRSALGASAAGRLQYLPKIHNPFRLRKSPRQVSRLRRTIVDPRI